MSAEGAISRMRKTPMKEIETLQTPARTKATPNQIHECQSAKQGKSHPRLHLFGTTTGIKTQMNPDS